MGQFRERMKEDLRLRGYCTSTVTHYLSCARRFVAHYKQPPTALGYEQIRAFLLYLLDDEQVSHTSFRKYRAALKFLYRVTLRRPDEVADLPEHRRRHRLPDVLSGTQVMSLLAAVTSVKHRMVLMTAYGAGLRISEACRLQVGDIDSRRMVIHVREGKGRRDRFTVLPQRLLVALRAYWRQARPQPYLFPGVRQSRTITPDAVRAVLHQARVAAGIDHAVTPHDLRRAFATHLLEGGTDVAVVQALLGHQRITTTMRYLRVSRAVIGRATSPLDRLGTPAGAVLG